MTTKECNYTNTTNATFRRLKDSPFLVCFPVVIILARGFFYFFSQNIFLKTKFILNCGIIQTQTIMTKAEKIQELVADLGWDYDRLSSCGQKTYNQLCELLSIETAEKFTYKAREGREVFTFEAKNEEEALFYCDTWNATLIGRVNEKGILIEG